MNIGELSKESGVSAKLIRHYEGIGLIPKAGRTENGYRSYHSDDIHSLRFVKRSRDLGFSLKEIKNLLGLWKNKSRSSKQVKLLAEKHLNDLDLKIKQLKDISDTLRNLVKHCHGDHRPDCPILKNLEES
ncbi:Cu(I)-responsive transcriptional regulator [Leptospira brenneri]|uniref:Cu(I)-responsive transcriptional regulator n=1 Tax=Leptospira brenneri TaxID=2023182 RepID=UPI000C29C1AB|nr:Cu(I)-responsive transcriptional regulator [Leptospira brenneri]PJZ44523.1 Cu(I)-responsive transcriptional regulator [Leptospira brenneri]